MARKRSWTTRIIVLGIVVLAGFGAYTLYTDNQDQADKVVQKVKKASKALTE